MDAAEGRGTDCRDLVRCKDIECLFIPSHLPSYLRSILKRRTRGGNSVSWQNARAKADAALSHHLCLSGAVEMRE